MLVAGKVPGLADDPDAMRWLKKAAKGGDAQGQRTLTEIEEMLEEYDAEEEG